MTNAVFSLSSDLVSIARADMIAGIDARKAMELRLKEGTALAQITATLSSHQARIARADAFTIAYLAVSSLNVTNENDDVTGTALFSSFFTMQARANACLNEKAIPRVLTLSRLLNGSVIDRSSADEEATACVIDALRKGFTFGTDIKRSMRLTMIAGTYGNKARADWNSEGTQGSSSLRSLLVLGIVSKAGHTWNVSDKARFARLCDGIDGIPYEGETTIVRDVPKSPLLALSAPSSVAGSVAVYQAATAARDDLTRYSTPASVKEGDAIDTTCDVLSEAENDALDMLALPAPVAAPAKAKRTRKAK